MSAAPSCARGAATSSASSIRTRALQNKPETAAAEAPVGSGMDKTISQHQKFPHPQIHHETLQSTDSSRCSYRSTPLSPRITAQETAYSSSDGAPDNPPGIKKSLPLESKFFECRMLLQCNHCTAEVKNLITMRRSIRHLDACRLVETCSIRKVLFLLSPHEWKNAEEAGGEGSRGPRTENPQ